MNKEIRRRIDEVCHGEVPEGYIVENHQLRPLDWKYEKIGKYLIAHNEYSNDTGRYMLATSSRQGLLPQTDYYNDQRFDETVGGFHVVLEDYVTYRHMSDDDVFKFNVNDLGAPVLVSPEYPVFTTKAELNQSLLIEYLNGTNEFRSFCRAQKKGSTRTRMYFSRLGEFMMPIPPILEQQKIADILATCDRLIDLKQKHVDELKHLKRTCLAKMFPREGADVPELRFPGFTAPWEQRKVGEVSKRVFVGLATSVTPYYREEGIPILRNLNIKENYLDDTDILFLERSYAESQVSKQIHTGDVLTVHTGYIGTSCVVPEKYDNCLTFTTLITTTDSSILNGEFLAQYLNSEIGMSAVQAVTTQGGRQNLNINDFVKVEIRYPSLAEQNGICKILRNIDHLITLHQRELEAEQRKKKALMQLLLTGLVRV